VSRAALALLVSMGVRGVALQQANAEGSPVIR
jgi:hypothetical protein